MVTMTMTRHDMKLVIIDIHGGVFLKRKRITAGDLSCFLVGE